MSKNFKAVLSSIVAVLLVSVFVFAAFANGGTLTAIEGESASDVTPVEDESDVIPEDESDVIPEDESEEPAPAEDESEDIVPEEESSEKEIKKVLLGDVNGNGVVNAADARLALRISAQLEIGEDWQLYAADVDFNDYVTAQDARDILRYSAQLISLAEWAEREAKYNSDFYNDGSVPEVIPSELA